MSELKGLSAVLKNLNKAIQGIELYTKEGLTEAALVVKRDSIKGTPIDLGNLRNSAFIMVTDSNTDNPSPLFRQESYVTVRVSKWGKEGRSDRKRIKKSSGEEVQKLSKDHSIAIAQANGIVQAGKHRFNAIVGYSANYALWVHEMPSHYNFNSGSNKFLEKALLKNKNRILQILIKHTKH